MKKNFDESRLAGLNAERYFLTNWVDGLYRFGPIGLFMVFPLFFRGDYVLSLGQTIGYYAIAVIGLNLLVGYTNQISIGHSGFMAVGAYTSALLATKLGWPLWLTLPLAALSSGLVGLIVALPAIRTRGLYLAMITIAFGFVVEILSQRWISLTGGTMGIYGVPTPSLSGKELGPWGYFYLVAITWALLQWMADNLVESRWGKTLIALKHSEDAAKSMGISITKQKVIAFVISAAYAGIAGFFLAHQTGYLNSDSFTVHISMFLLVALVIGGSGSRWGPLVGAALLTFINQVLAGLYEYRFFLYGGTFLAVLTLLPEGVVGLAEKRIRRVLKAKVLPESRDEDSAQDISALFERREPKDPGSTILTIKQLSRSFGGLMAVNGLDLSVRNGQVHAIIGPNGAGKTTLINLITGSLNSHQGTIIFNNLNLNGLKAHRRGSLGMARTFQNLKLFSEISVLDNVLVGFYRHFSSGSVSYALSLPASRKEEAGFKDSALNLLRFVGISHLASKSAGDLSYGHQKLLEIARALALKPDLLLLDEPVAGLNRSEVEEVFSLLSKLRAMGMTILLIEHNMDFVMRISDRISVHNFGIKIAEGTPQEIRRDPKVIEAYLGRGDLAKTLENIRRKEG
ncbi:MAG: branched-chain amino acid ABC transporter ATP-binding protein/permease [Deltaproteobacteria bacterium]|nr:branched-chain amino acid ABC transporter ATP-binding protein/permease [Deltaproteobacteria bacterium]